MTRVVTIAGTAITSTSDLDSIVVGGQAKQGDSALSEIIVYDDTNSLFGTAESFIRKQWSVTENASGTAVYLARGRIAAFETHRGDEDSVQGAKVQYTWALEDSNLELRGHDINDWVRPAETGRARVIALGTAYLNGSPRATTNLNTTTYVPNTNTVSMPAKTYNNTDAFEVISECAAAEDKKFFVTVDHELFYDIESSTSYVAGLEITDGVSGSDPDGTNYFAPIWDMGSALSWEGQNYASRLRMTYNQDSSVLVTDAASEAAHDMWTAHVADTETTSAAMATAFATAELNYRKGGERTYALSLKIPAAQAYKIKYGQLIYIQTQAAVDTPTRARRRIAELMWEPDGPYWYIARLNLDRPVRRRLRGAVSGATPTGPKPAPACEPDTVVSPTTIWYWTWTTNDNDDGSNTYDGGLDRTTVGDPTYAYPPADAAFASSYGRNSGSAYASQKVPISASTTYSFRGDFLWEFTPSTRNVAVRWYDVGNNLLRTDTWVNGSGHALDTKYHEVENFTSPSTATHVLIHYSNFAGLYADNVYIETPGSVSAATNDEFCLTDPGDSPYYMKSDDPRVVALVDQMETVGFSWKMPVRAASTSAGTLASSFETGDVLDGVTLAVGDRILLKDQASGADNGIYTVNASGAPTRAVDFATDEQALGAATFVSEGAVNANEVFVQTTNDPIELGVTSLVFAQVGASSAADFLTKTGGEGHTVVTVSDAGSALTLDLADGNVFEITLTEACTISATGFTLGEWCEGSVIVHQDGTGGWTLAYAAAFELPVGGSNLPTTAVTSSGFGFGSLDGGTTIYWWSMSGTNVSALTDLSDVTITTPTNAQRLRYNGSLWVNSSLRWIPLTVSDGTNYLPLVDGSGNQIMAEA